MGVYDFEMEMCCSMQVSSLIHELEQCKQRGDVKGRVVHPLYPAAPSRDTLFDSMNLYARLDDEGKVELSGAVYYWNHIDGDTQQTTIIKTFSDIDTCLEWLKGEETSDYIASKL